MRIESSSTEPLQIPQFAIQTTSRGVSDIPSTLHLAEKENSSEIISDINSLTLIISLFFSPIREKFIRFFCRENSEVHKKFEDCFTKRIQELCTQNLLKTVRGTEWRAAMLFQVNDRVIGCHYEIVKRSSMSKFRDQAIQKMQQALNQHAVLLNKGDKISIDFLIPEKSGDRRSVHTFYVSEHAYPPKSEFRNFLTTSTNPDSYNAWIKVFCQCEDSKMQQALTEFLNG